MAGRYEDPSQRLAKLSESHPLLAAALAELRGAGISNATAGALASTRISNIALTEFLSLAARDAPRHSLEGLAMSIPEYVDKLDAGHEALDFCLVQGGLTERELATVAIRMVQVRRPEAVVWCHHRMTAVVRNDILYNSFLRDHRSVVFERCLDEMSAYLLQPDRGPDRYNIDSFDLILLDADDPRPFLDRWHDWIQTGQLDESKKAGSNADVIHYKILNERWDVPVFATLIQATHQHVVSLFRSSDTRRSDAIRHLYAMVDTQYRGAEVVVRDIPARIEGLQPEDVELVEVLVQALRALADWQADPNDGIRERRAVESRNRAIDAYLSATT
jgi:hypothetical protein